MNVTAVTTTSKPTYTIPRGATREHLLEAIATWESGGSVTGSYTTDLYRYWKQEGPSFSATGLRQYEAVRRIMEGHA